MRRNGLLPNVDSQPGATPEAGKAWLAAKRLAPVMVAVMDALHKTLSDGEDFVGTGNKDDKEHLTTGSR